MELPTGMRPVIEVGPEGGSRGGEVVAAMTPTDLALSSGSASTPCLATALGRQAVPVQQQAERIQMPQR